MTGFISNRLSEKGEPNKDFSYRNTQEATGYFNLGFSFNPFAKEKDKGKINLYSGLPWK